MSVVKAERARQNRAYVRELLRQRQPGFAVALASAEQDLSCQGPGGFAIGPSGLRKEMVRAFWKLARRDRLARDEGIDGGGASAEEAAIHYRIDES